MRLIFIGPPGAGKGTQTIKICDHYNITAISSGDILRKNKHEGTPLGKIAAEYIDRGHLVPDEVIIEMIQLELQKPEFREGFILDGFPRTAPQAEALDELLIKLGKELDAALVITVPDEELVRRLTARRTCKECGNVHNLITDPPKIGGICDRCGGQLYQRFDDNEITVKNRLDIYKDKTAPLFYYYKSKGLLKEVDGTGSIDEVFEEIIEVMEDVKEK